MTSANIARYVSIIAAMSRREIESRYKSTALGGAWYIFSGLVMIAIYSVVFASIFKGRWANEAYGKLDFTALIFVGLLFFNALAEVLSRAPTVFVANASIVKRMVFPVFILPVVPVVVAIFNMMVSGAILMAYCIYYSITLHIAGVNIFLLIIPFTLLLLALSYFLSSSSVYFRDLVHVTAILSALLMFMSTLFYPLDLLPKAWAWLAAINPINFPIDQARNSLLLGQPMLLSSFAFACATSIILLCLSLVWYRLLRPGFVDVL